MLEALIEFRDVVFSYGLDDEGTDEGTDGAASGSAARGGAGAGAASAPASASFAVSAQGAAQDAPGKDCGERRNAVDGVTMAVSRGEFLAVLGKNGSGKSTLAKLMNALLIPTSGEVTVKGMRTDDAASQWEIRRVSGMVFQNPDNQIVGTTVEEDVAFGVENLGVPAPMIRERIDAAMEQTGVSGLSDRPPYQLSGGQKQRVAIAGILAMRPECIILDEATSMLDPDGRADVLRLVKRLNRDEGIAVVLITHHMDEVAFADRVCLIDQGRIAMSCKPRELFSDVAAVRKAGLSVPQVTETLELLREDWSGLPRGVTDAGEACRALAELVAG